MKLIFRYFLRQFVQYWQRLRFLTRLQILLLLIIFFSVFSEKLSLFLSSILQAPDTTPLGVAAFFSHCILLLYAVTTPVIYDKLIPRQKAVQLLRLQPLDAWQSLALLVVFYLKYQSPLLIICLPFLAGMAFSAGLTAFLYSLAYTIIVPVLLLMAMALPGVTNIRGRARLWWYAGLNVIYFGIFFLLYYYNTVFLIYSAAAVLAIALFLFRQWMRWGIHWERNIPFIARFAGSAHERTGYFKYSSLPRLFPAVIQPLFAAEILNMLRNRSYLSLKLIYMLVFCITAVFLHFYFPSNFTEIISVTAAVFIWLHYSHQFNEKYVRSESAWFVKTLPFRYYQMWLAKFFSELVYLTVILLLYLCALLLNGENFDDMLRLTISLSLFALFILGMITSVKILFYDNPRFAGYAYHFMVIFSAVMIANFYLVGPVITFLIVVYINFLSYRQFAG